MDGIPDQTDTRRVGRDARHYGWGHAVMFVLGTSFAGFVSDGQVFFAVATAACALGVVVSGMGWMQAYVRWHEAVAAHERSKGRCEAYDNLQAVYEEWTAE